MQARVGKRYTVDEFLAWARENPDTKCELVDGVIVPKNPGEPFGMAPETKLHAWVKGQTTVVLRNAVDAAGMRCAIYLDGPGIRINERRLFIPDLIVECDDPTIDSSLMSEAPTIVVEILSPSNSVSEMSRKLLAYFNMPTVRHYLVIDPRTRTLDHHFRGEAGAIEMASHEDGTLLLDPPGLKLDVPALFP